MKGQLISSIIRTPTTLSNGKVINNARLSYMMMSLVITKRNSDSHLINTLEMKKVCTPGFRRWTLTWCSLPKRFSSERCQRVALSTRSRSMKRKGLDLQPTRIPHHCTNQSFKKISLDPSKTVVLPNLGVHKCSSITIVRPEHIINPCRVITNWTM